jgi:MFS superfamily sulfate permease-like transporter
MFSNIKRDIPASFVVFLVALPLCLGIAMASGAPLIAGVIGGIIGGIVVGLLSGSQVGVTGPAAGLTVIVLSAITDLPTYEVFLLTVVLSGIIQVLLGYARAGIIGYFIPSSVIKGMLSAIGVIILLKQIPHAVGYNVDPEGDLAFLQADGHNTFSELYYMFDSLTWQSVFISLFSLIILIAWDHPFIKKLSFSQFMPGPLIVVLFGVVSAFILKSDGSIFTSDMYVALPVVGSLSEYANILRYPDFGYILNSDVWKYAITFAFVGSLETLLNVEAADKLDPYKRATPTNQELKAQGVGNLLSGLIGGIPITQVVVRSSANVESGGRTKLSAVLHGVILLIALVAFPKAMNMIPLAALAAILIHVGYKLAKPGTFKAMYQKGRYQFIPYMVTFLAILFTDLLVGIIIGVTVGAFFVLLYNFRSPFKVGITGKVDKHDFTFTFSEHITFLNKATIRKAFDQIPTNSVVIIDASNTKEMDMDVIEIIDDFIVSSGEKSIEVKTIGFPITEIETHNPLKHMESYILKAK